MRTWTKILPYFFIEWYSKKYTERFTMNEKWVEDYPTIVSPYEGIYIRLKPYRK